MLATCPICPLKIADEGSSRHNGEGLHRVAGPGMGRSNRSRCVMRTTPSASSAEEATIKYVCGIDIGSQSCAGCVTRPDKRVVVKPITFANAREGWQVWEKKLSQLDAPPSHILTGMEATSRYAHAMRNELSPVAKPGKNMSL